MNLDKEYEFFQLPKTASDNDIREKYLKLVLKHHHDKGGNTETFQKLENTYNKIMSDREKERKNTFC